MDKGSFFLRNCWRSSVCNQSFFLAEHNCKIIFNIPDLLCGAYLPVSLIRLAIMTAWCWWGSTSLMLIYISNIFEKTTNLNNQILILGQADLPPSSLGHTRLIGYISLQHEYPMVWYYRYIVKTGKIPSINYMKLQGISVIHPSFVTSWLHYFSLTTYNFQLPLPFSFNFHFIIDQKY